VRQGQIVNGYRITTKPTNTDAGKCLWAFAEKGGKEVFIKEFLDPKRPRADSMGSVADKNRMFALCKEFEDRHWRVIERIARDDLDAGNLVLADDFFHEGARYYKVTRRLRPAGGKAPHELDAAGKAVLLATLADSLRLLHRLGIVHGDLKPTNVVLHQPAGSDLRTAKLIDFDDAYVSGSPPARDVIGGDVVHGAPEWVRYLRGDRTVRPEHLTTAVDLFAFGLVAHLYVTGALPRFGGPHGTAAEAVAAGERPRFDPRLTPALTSTLRALLDPDPRARPAIADVRDVLVDPANLTFAAPVRASRLRVNVAGRGPGPRPTTEK
jgi:hypothetical protein